MSPAAQPAAMDMHTAGRWPAVLALAGLMIATRGGHLPAWLPLADASMAVFFLLGLAWPSRAAFAAFIALVVALDAVAVTLGGVSDFCITVAYSFLLPAYGVLWWGGRQARGRSLPAALGLATVAGTASFLVSNGAFYWLGGRYPDPHVAEYLARVWKWGPLFLGTTMAYVAGILAVTALVRRAAPVRLPPAGA